jgi:small Trp-rich protein
MVQGAPASIAKATMYLLGLGLIFLAMKYFELGPVAAWSWWLVMLPFALTVAWWAWADSSGYTKRKVMEREVKRRDDRLERTKQALDANYKKKRR